MEQRRIEAIRGSAAKVKGVRTGKGIEIVKCALAWAASSFFWYSEALLLASLRNSSLLDSLATQSDAFLETEKCCSILSRPFLSTPLAFFLLCRRRALLRQRRPHPSFGARRSLHYRSSVVHVFQIAWRPLLLRDPISLVLQPTVSACH